MSSSPSYILSIDQGTSSSRCLIFCRSSWNIIARNNQKFTPHYPQPSWVEHDPEDIWNSVGQAIGEAVRKAQQNEPQFSLSRISRIGITNQRETLCFLDRKTGRALRRAIVWQCKRSSDLCDELIRDGLNTQRLKELTGLPLDPYFSGTKLLWALRHDPLIAEKWHKGQLLVGTIDSFLIYRLTGGASWVTEPSNACRTLMCSLKEGRWSEELLNMLNIPLPDGRIDGKTSPLAQILPSYGCFGHTRGLEFLPDGLEISGVLGDQQAATLAHGCTQPGHAKCTYGTGAFLLSYAGTSTPLPSNHGLLTTIGWQLGNQRHYLLEGCSFIAGAGLDYLAQQWKFFDDPRALDAMIEHDRHRAAPRIYFVPALVGLGAPHWQSGARGALFGLSRDTTSRQILRAMIEGIAFSVHDLITAMEADLGTKLSNLKADGGLSQSYTLLQIQTNLLGAPVTRGAHIEATALGAALIAAGPDTLDLLEKEGPENLISLDEVTPHKRGLSAAAPYRPEISSKERDELLEGWHKAVQAVMLFAS